MHLETILKDLRERFARCELAVSPPLVAFRESIAADADAPEGAQRPARVGGAPAQPSSLPAGEASVCMAALTVPGSALARSRPSACIMTPYQGTPSPASALQDCRLWLLSALSSHQLSANHLIGMCDSCNMVCGAVGSLAGQVVEAATANGAVLLRVRALPLPGAAAAALDGASDLLGALLQRRTDSSPDPGDAAAAAAAEAASPDANGGALRAGANGGAAAPTAAPPGAPDGATGGAADAGGRGDEMPSGGAGRTEPGPGNGAGVSAAEAGGCAGLEAGADASGGTATTSDAAPDVAAALRGATQCASSSGYERGAGKAHANGGGSPAGPSSAARTPHPERDSTAPTPGTGAKAPPGPHPATAPGSLQAPGALGMLRARLTAALSGDGGAEAASGEGAGTQEGGLGPALLRRAWQLGPRSTGPNILLLPPAPGAPGLWHVPAAEVVALGKRPFAAHGPATAGGGGGGDDADVPAAALEQVVRPSPDLTATAASSRPSCAAKHSL